MNKPTIHLHDVRWKKALRPYCKTVEGIIASIPSGVRSTQSRDLPQVEGDPSASLGIKVVSIVLADDALVRSLNKQYRGRDKATNVLSFPNAEAPLGDVILAFETIAREAHEQGKTFRHHAAHLIVHGVLHLMGHDHEDEADAEAMEALEVKILKKLGIADPY